MKETLIFKQVRENVYHEQPQSKHVVSLHSQTAEIKIILIAFFQTSNENKSLGTVSSISFATGDLNKVLGCTEDT